MWSVLLGWWAKPIKSARHAVFSEEILALGLNIMVAHEVIMIHPSKHSKCVTIWGNWPVTLQVQNNLGWCELAWYKGLGMYLIAMASTRFLLCQRGSNAKLWVHLGRTKISSEKGTE